MRYGEGFCGKLIFWLYGFKPAASAWENIIQLCLRRSDSRGGKGHLRFFWNKGSGVRMVVHGDDFTLSGVRKELEAVA